VYFQVTLEITRQLIENGGFYFLDKDKRGDFKTIEGLQYLGKTTLETSGEDVEPHPKRVEKM
jgi:dynein heavy chain